MASSVIGFTTVCDLDSTDCFEALISKPSTRKPLPCEEGQFLTSGRGYLLGKTDEALPKKLVIIDNRGSSEGSREIPSTRKSHLVCKFYTQNLIKSKAKKTQVFILPLNKKIPPLVNLPTVQPPKKTSGKTLCVMQIPTRFFNHISIIPSPTGLYLRLLSFPACFTPLSPNLPKELLHPPRKPFRIA